MSTSQLARVIGHRGGWEQGNEIVINPSGQCGKRCCVNECKNADDALIERVQAEGGRGRKLETPEGTYVIIGGKPADRVKSEVKLGGRW